MTASWHSLNKFMLLLFFFAFSGAASRTIGGGTLIGSPEFGYYLSEGPLPILLKLAVLTGLFALSLRRATAVAATVFKGALPLAILSIYALSSVLWSGSLTTALEEGAMFLLMVWVGCHFGTAENFRALYESIFSFSVWLIVTTLIVSLVFPGFAFHQSGGGEYFNEHAGLLKGFFLHKNDNALMLGISALVVSTRTIWEKVTLRRCLVILISVYLIIQTGSAKILISVPIALCLTSLALRIPPGPLRALVIVYFAFLLLFVTYGGFFDPVIDFVLQMVGRDRSLSSRTLIWQALSERLQDGYFLFGAGYGYGWEEFGRSAVMSRVGSDVGHPHNGFLQIVIDLGVVGASIFCYWLLTVFVTTSVLPHPKKSTDLDGKWLVLPLFIFYILVNLGGTYSTTNAVVLNLILIASSVALRASLHKSRVRRCSEG